MALGLKGLCSICVVLQPINITVKSKWACRRPTSPAFPLLSQALAQQVQIKENIKAPRHWPLWGEFPAQRANNAENVSIRWRRHEVWQQIMYRQTTLILNTFEIPFSLLSTYFDVWSGHPILKLIVCQQIMFPLLNTHIYLRKNGVFNVTLQGR